MCWNPRPRRILAKLTAADRAPNKYRHQPTRVVHQTTPRPRCVACVQVEAELHARVGERVRADATALVALLAASSTPRRSRSSFLPAFGKAKGSDNHQSGAQAEDAEYGCV
jgi:hypothetical protein